MRRRGAKADIPSFDSGWIHHAQAPSETPKTGWTGHTRLPYGRHLADRRHLGVEMSRIWIVFVAVFALSGCYRCMECSRTPQGLPADDNRPTGLFKGVIAGEDLTGTVEVVISTDQTIGDAHLNLPDGDKDADSFSIDDGEDGVVYTFNGSDFTMTLEIADNGDVLRDLLELGGEDVDLDLFKESSEDLVECFEGTWIEVHSEEVLADYQESGEELPDPLGGIWNFAVRDAELVGSFAGDAGGSLRGIVEPSVRTVEIWITSDLEAALADGREESAEGELPDDSATGTWHYWSSGTWAGLRTL